MKLNLKKELIALGFDSKTLRLLLDWKTIKRLPIKYCGNKRPVYRAMEGWFYNPVGYYPRNAKRIRGEMGYDEKFRYVLKYCNSELEVKKQK